MAEFCLECMNKYIEDKKLTEKDVVEDWDLCEGCGEWKLCVVAMKGNNILKRFKDKSLRLFKYFRHTD